VFHFLGVPEIHQTAKPTIPIREYKLGTIEPTKTYMMVAHNEPNSLIPFNNARFIGQQTLEGILRSHLEKKYNCFVELDTALQSFEQDGDHVFAKLVKKKNGEEISEVLETSYLIGTDGAKGVTRKQLGLTFLGETRNDFHAIVGDIRLEIKGLDRDHWHLFGERATNMVMLRPTDEIAPDGFQFILSSKDRDLTQLTNDEKLLFQFLSDVVGSETECREIVWSSEFRPSVRMVDKFGIGRVFVAGDAAHVHSPTGGQGLNSSAQDAFNIAWKISLVYKGLSPASLLDSYTTERLPVIAEMLNVTTELLQRIRTAPLDHAMERERKLDMLGVNYRFSPIVRDEFSEAGPVSSYRVLEEGVLAAGDRAPDAPELRVGADGGATSLFAVFSPKQHTVLVFGPDVASATDILGTLSTYPRAPVRLVVVLPQGSAASEVDVLVDEAGHAYRGYLAERGDRRVVVVRPDGVVGAMVRGAEGVTAYFEKIFV
jgi:2-polyprenyl-6-methoxyphenol hydroxylase-like FAD-dependent oxidoreductase